MCQPSNLDVKSTVGSPNSVSLLLSWYLPKDLYDNLKTKQVMKKSQLGFEKGVEYPSTEPIKTLNAGSNDTTPTLLCHANDYSFGTESPSEESGLINRFLSNGTVNSPGDKLLTSKSDPGFKSPNEHGSTLVCCHAFAHASLPKFLPNQFDDESIFDYSLPSRSKEGCWIWILI